MEEIAVLLELVGENPFKARAYRNAARAIAAYQGDLEEAVRRGGLRQIRGIGEALSKKISELVTTGKLSYYEGLKARVPAGLMEMARIPFLGPKRIKLLYEKLGISNVGELEYACLENRLVSLAGFGARTQQRILKGIEAYKRYQGSFLYGDIAPLADSFIKAIDRLPGVLQVALAGSMRRRLEVVKDIDIVVAMENNREGWQGILSLPQVTEVLVQGEEELRLRLSAGITTDIRLVTPREFPFALLHLAGSKEHNILLRARSKGLGMKLNEYGLFADDHLIPCTSEEEIYRALGMTFIPPELREGMGEIEAALHGTIPRLLKEGDLRGVFHIHTAASDGVDDIPEIVSEARRLGFGYIGVADHSRSAAYAGGLSKEEVERQQRQIDGINRRGVGLQIFKGIEVEILPDGRLDYDDEILAGFDFVIGAVHSHFQMGEQEMTQRIVRAIRSNRLTMLAHPTGRLLLAREPYPVDIKEVIKAAADHGVAIELNANPHRLDLDWRWIRYAKGEGVKISINPDAHSAKGLGDVYFVVGIARKGWLEANDVINTRGVEEIKDFFRRR